ncbi:porin family protein [Chitinophagaceae bacterium MMS25-I14]
MKKILLFTLLGATGLTQANAQWVKAGPEIGLNLSSFASRINGDKQSNNLLPGLKLGGVVDIGFTRNFSFQPGLFFSMKGAAAKTTDRTVTGGGTTITDTYKDRFWANYIEMPMNVEFRVGDPRYGQFFFGGGPYIAAALGGKITSEHTHTVSNDNGTTVNTTSNDHSISIGDNANSDDLRPFDGGLNFNAGYQARNGFYVRGNIGIGLANVLPEGDGDNYIHNWGLGVSAGYLFGAYHGHAHHHRR